MTDAFAPVLQRRAAATLSEQLCAQFAGRIRDRLLPPGSRLPSVRDCARRYALSTQTVVAAYDRLQAQGLIEARPQRGFFVRHAPAERDATIPDSTPAPRAPTDATALVRGMFHQMGGSRVALRGAPGSGVLPPEWLQTPALGAVLRRIARDDLDQSALHYGTPAGDGTLRAALSRQLAGIDLRVAPERIVTTTGA